MADLESARAALAGSAPRVAAIADQARGAVSARTPAPRDAAPTSLPQLKDALAPGQQTAGEVAAALKGLSSGAVEGLYRSMLDRLQAGKLPEPFPADKQSVSASAVAAAHRHGLIKTVDDVKHFARGALAASQQAQGKGADPVKAAVAWAQQAVAQKKAEQAKQPAAGKTAPATPTPTPAPAQPPAAPAAQPGTTPPAAQVPAQPGLTDAERDELRKKFGAAQAALIEKSLAPQGVTAPPPASPAQAPAQGTAQPPQPTAWPASNPPSASSAAPPARPSPPAAPPVAQTVPFVTSPNPVTAEALKRLERAHEQEAQQKAERSQLLEKARQEAPVLNRLDEIRGAAPPPATPADPAMRKAVEQMQREKKQKAEAEAVRRARAKIDPEFAAGERRRVNRENLLGTMFGYTPVGLAEMPEQGSTPTRPTSRATSPAQGPLPRGYDVLQGMNPATGAVPAQAAAAAAMVSQLAGVGPGQGVASTSGGKGAVADSMDLQDIKDSLDDAVGLLKEIRDRLGGQGRPAPSGGPSRMPPIGRR